MNELFWGILTLFVAFLFLGFIVATFVFLGGWISLFFG